MTTTSTQNSDDEPIFMKVFCPMAGVTMEIERQRRNGQVRWHLDEVTAVRDPRYGIELTVRTSKARATSLPFVKPEVMEKLAEVARAAAVNAGGAKLVGPTILQTMWEELDAICDRIFSGAEAEDGGDKFRASQMAWVIAYFTNPYAPNVLAIKKEAKRRWEEDDYV